MAITTKVYNCTFTTFKENAEYQGFGYHEDWLGVRPNYATEPNTFIANVDMDAGTTFGFVTVDDAAARPTGFDSLDGIENHFKRIHIPKLPANSTVLDSSVQWSVSAHIINRVENISGAPGYYSVDHRVTRAVLGFPTVLGTGQLPTASDYIAEGRNLPAMPPVLLSAGDGTLDYSGAASSVSSMRSAVFTGLTQVNAFGSDGFLLNTWRDGGFIGSHNYIALYPCISFEEPIRTWSGRANGLRISDIIYASGTFVISLTYSTP